jgi:redox-sensing transcriptional repressor
MEPTNDKSKSRATQGVPEPTIRRMPVYLNIVKKIKEAGQTTISAPQIGQQLNLDSTQVVKDLSYTGVVGSPKSVIRCVINSYLKDFLGYNRNHEAFLVGAGFWGSALIQYPGFPESVIKIVAAFDNDRNKIGTEIAGVPVFGIEKYRDMAERLHISIGIITTPPEIALEIARIIDEVGRYQGYLIVSPAKLKVPPHIIIQDLSSMIIWQ